MSSCADFRIIFFLAGPAGGDEKRAAEYAFRPEQAERPSLYAVRGSHRSAAPDPISGPAGSGLQPKGFPDLVRSKGTLQEKAAASAGQAPGQNRAVLSASLCPQDFLNMALLPKSELNQFSGS